MKNCIKVLLGFFIALIYIPISIGISYTVISKLTNIFNAGYKSAILNILFVVIGIMTLLLLVMLLDKIVNKVVEKRIKFMSICCTIPIIIFCVGLVILNFNFFNIQKELNSFNMDLIGDGNLLNTALISISSMFIGLSFIYLMTLLLYVIVHKLEEFRSNKKTKLEK